MSTPANTTLRERLKVATFLKANPTATNEEIVVATKVKKPLSGIRKWITTKGVDEYIAMITLLRNAERKEKQVARREKSGKTKAATVGEFTNQVGENKNVARNKMVNAIANSGIKKGKVLTLPHTEWTIERMISQYVSKVFNYVAVERNFEDYVTMKLNSKQYGQKNECYEGSISDKIIPMGVDSYSHMLLDYCGLLETNKNDILHALTNNLVVNGGTIAVTVLKARCSSPSVVKTNRLKAKWTGETIKDTDNASYIKTFFELVAAITDFEVIESLEYYDSAPMMLTILRRKS